MASPTSGQLHGIVDMGSNGIRFSISDLSPLTARSLPTIFQSRDGISLYDAQYSTGTLGPIPQPTIDSVLAALLRFKVTCADFGVPKSNITVLATEATRNASNSVDYRQQIFKATGWRVKMLTKEMEGRIGAMGIASSFQAVEGLVMDLGGGSTQITWMISREGEVQTRSNGSFSFPYGAAALMRRLNEAESEGARAKARLGGEIKSNFENAYKNLDIPGSLLANAERDGGFTLYLSGGGFRGWGYLLMSQSQNSPYPIPIINGFQAPKEDFQSIGQIQHVASSDPEIFRVSKRRAAQVPAVAFLVNLLCLAIPNIKDICFCQGGVREGFLFDSLDTETRAMDPLAAASVRYAKPAANQIAALLLGAIPRDGNRSETPPPSFNSTVITAFANLMYEQSTMSKESASLAGLYCPITGVLASAHGVSHTDRALLALLLCQRWSGDLAPPHDSLQDRLRQIVSREEVWWCSYLGHVAAMVGHVYPAGWIGDDHDGGREGGQRLSLQANWANGLGKKGLDRGVRLTIGARKPDDPMTSADALRDLADDIEKVGKKKQRAEGVGYTIEVVLA